MNTSADGREVDKVSPRTNSSKKSSKKGKKKTEIPFKPNRKDEKDEKESIQDKSAVDALTDFNKDEVQKVSSGEKSDHAESGSDTKEFNENDIHLTLKSHSNFIANQKIYNDKNDFKINALEGRLVQAESQLNTVQKEVQDLKSNDAQNLPHPVVDLPEDAAENDFNKKIKYHEEVDLFVTIGRAMTMDCSTPTDFIKRNFTGFFGVKEIYRRYVEERSSEIENKFGKSKWPFSPQNFRKLFDLLLIKFPYYSEPDDTKTALEQMMKDAVNDKLNELNDHFFSLINNKDDNPLEANEKVGFEDYNDFANDLKKFSDLDIVLDALIAMYKVQRERKLFLIDGESNIYLQVNAQIDQIEKADDNLIDELVANEEDNDRNNEEKNDSPTDQFTNEKDEPLSSEKEASEQSAGQILNRMI